MQKVTAIETKNDKNGNPMKVTTFDNGVTVYVNSKYDSAIYEQVIVGAEFELTKEGDFNKIKYTKPEPTGGNFGASRGMSGVKVAQERKEGMINNAMGRKENAITLAGTARDATLLTVAMLNQPNMIMTTEDVKEEWTMWRNWLLSQMGDMADITETKVPFQG